MGSDQEGVVRFMSKTEQECVVPEGDNNSQLPLSPRRHNVRKNTSFGFLAFSFGQPGMPAWQTWKQAQLSCICLFLGEHTSGLKACRTLEVMERSHGFLFPPTSGDSKQRGSKLSRDVCSCAETKTTLRHCRSAHIDKVSSHALLHVFLLSLGAFFTIKILYR